MKLIKILFPLLLALSASAQVEFTENPVILADSYPHQTITKTAYLINKSDQDFIVSDVRSDCGCLVSELETKTLKPGIEYPMEVSLETRATIGDLNRKVYIIGEYADGKKEAFVLPLTTKVDFPPNWKFPIFGEVTLFENDNNFKINFEYLGDNPPKLEDISLTMTQDLSEKLSVNKIDIEDNNYILDISADGIELGVLTQGLIRFRVKGEDYVPTFQTAIGRLSSIEFSPYFETTNLSPFPLIIPYKEDKSSLSITVMLKEANPDIIFTSDDNYELVTQENQNNYYLTLFIEKSPETTETTYITATLKTDSGAEFLKLPVILLGK